MHTNPDIGHLLATLENVIHQEFIPSLSGRPATSSTERKIFALPARLGVLGLTNPTACADGFFQFSVKQTKMLVELIVSQQLSSEVDLERILSAKKEIKQLSLLIAIQQVSDLDKYLDQLKRVLLPQARKRARPSGSLPYLLRSMASICIKLNLGIALCLRYGWAIHKYMIGEYLEFWILLNHVFVDTNLK